MFCLLFTFRNCNRDYYYITHCLIYDIEKNEFDETNITVRGYQKIEMYAFPETNQYALFFYKEEESYKNIVSEFKLIFFDVNLNQISSSSNNEIKIILPECSLVNGFSLVYSKVNEKYNIIYDCDNSTSLKLTINYFSSIFSANFTNYYPFLFDSSDDSISNELS